MLNIDIGQKAREVQECLKLAIMAVKRIPLRKDKPIFKALDDFYEVDWVYRQKVAEENLRNTLLLVKEQPKIKLFTPSIKVYS